MEVLHAVDSDSDMECHGKMSRRIDRARETESDRDSGGTLEMEYDRVMRFNPVRGMSAKIHCSGMNGDCVGEEGLCGWRERCYGPRFGPLRLGEPCTAPVPVKMDDDSLFRSISYALCCDEAHHRLFREKCATELWHRQGSDYTQALKESGAPGTAIGILANLFRLRIYTYCENGWTVQEPDTFVPVDQGIYLVKQGSHYRPVVCLKKANGWCYGLCQHGTKGAGCCRGPAHSIGGWECVLYSWQKFLDWLGKGWWGDIADINRALARVQQNEMIISEPLHKKAFGATCSITWKSGDLVKSHVMVLFHEEFLCANKSSPDPVTVVRTLMKGQELCIAQRETWPVCATTSRFYTSDIPLQLRRMNALEAWWGVWDDLSLRRMDLILETVGRFGADAGRGRVQLCECTAVNALARDKLAIMCASTHERDPGYVCDILTLLDERTIARYTVDFTSSGVVLLDGDRKRLWWNATMTGLLQQFATAEQVVFLRAAK